MTKAIDRTIRSLKKARNEMKDSDLTCRIDLAINLLEAEYQELHTHGSYKR